MKESLNFDLTGAFSYLIKVINKGACSVPKELVTFAQVCGMKGYYEIGACTKLRMTE